MRFPGVPSPAPKSMSYSSQDEDRRKSSALDPMGPGLWGWGPSRALRPLSPQGQRQERLSEPRSVRANITRFWRHPYPHPHCCLPPALPSAVEGGGSHAQCCCSVMEPWPRCAGLRAGEGGSNQAEGRGPSDCHAPLPQNCPAWSRLHSPGGRKRRASPGPGKHFSSSNHLLTGGVPPQGQVPGSLTCPHLCTDLGDMLRPSLVFSLI